MLRKYIEVSGIVQGVGFRPFVYRIALKNNLKGWVKNTSRGVYIDVEGEDSNIQCFINELGKDAPSISKIEEIYVEEREVKEFNEFSIVESHGGNGKITLISPDIATCDMCMKEVKDVKNPRRYEYAFTNCTNCGPRFSIIKDIPYDRKNTAMSKFNMCERCNGEYENPLDRRFHAEPTCCNDCGPQLELLDNKGNVVLCENKFIEIQDLLFKGKIIGVKGLGGFNIICNGDDFQSIEVLRKRKKRRAKPLALMFKDTNVVNEFCYLNKKEKYILEGEKKPIILLKKKNNSLPNNISFNNKTLGVVLPYTPLHYLLFGEKIKVLVFTSGNISGTPMIFNNEEAVEELGDIVDYLLIHNRDINFPVDDSVVEVVNDIERVIRPGRGYAPVTRNFEVQESILALGSELKNTFTITKERKAFVSPYMGNMDNLKAFNNFERSIQHFRSVYDINVNALVYDAHPNYWSNKYLQNYNCKKIKTYHHHSHIVSCMVDNNEKDNVIGLAFDGIGYGEDGHIWGGEFLICNYRSFERIGHLSYFPLPGGDGATKNPWRIGISLIYKSIGRKYNGILPESFKKINFKTLRYITGIIDKEINSPLCSSIGRLFDGIASILGFMDEVSFEGEAAIYLENLANKYKSNEKYNYDITLYGKEYIVEYNTIIKEILLDIKSEKSKECIARKFHNTVIRFSKEICLLIRGEYNINKVALSGGVFQNKILLQGLMEALEHANFNVLTHKEIPCNDSGLSIGQLYIGKEQLEN